MAGAPPRATYDTRNSRPRKSPLRTVSDCGTAPASPSALGLNFCCLAVDTQSDMSFRPRVLRLSAPRGRGSSTRLPRVTVGLSLFALACIAWIGAGSGEGLGTLGALV